MSCSTACSTPSSAPSTGSASPGTSLYCALLYSTDLYRDETLKLNFERVCVYFRKNGDYIPLSFILGFYVTQVRKAKVL